MAPPNKFHTKAKTARSPTTLMMFPTEVRLKIYRFFFSAKHRGPLRRPPSLPYRCNPLDVAILATNRLIYQEVLPELYDIHPFHFEMRNDKAIFHRGILSSHYSMLKHVSLDIMWHYRSGADALIAKHLEVLSKQSSSLKTLTLHILPNDVGHTYPPEPWAQEFGDNSSALLYELWAKLDRFSIVTFGPTNNFALLKNKTNGDASAWITKKHQSWPALTFSIDQQGHLYPLQRRGSVNLPTQYYIGCTEITSFHAYSPRLMEELKKGKQIGLGMEIFK